MITIKINLNDDNDIQSVVWEDKENDLSVEDVATYNELLYDLMKKKLMEHVDTVGHYRAIQFGS